MLDNTIHPKEFLYRAVTTKPLFWDEDKQRPSSAIFKDSKGVSVDRLGERLENILIDTFCQKFECKAIVKIQAETCTKLATFPIYYPLPDNVYHALIYQSESIIQIKSSIAKKLRDECLLIFENNK